MAKKALQYLFETRWSTKLAFRSFRARTAAEEQARTFLQRLELRKDDVSFLFPEQVSVHHPTRGLVLRFASEVLLNIDWYKARLSREVAKQNLLVGLIIAIAAVTLLAAARRQAALQGAGTAVEVGVWLAVVTTLLQLI